MRYFKMNGCGNDFVMFDARAHGNLALTPAQAIAIASRADGIGCDQVIAIERSVRGDAFMRIWNADGQEVAACGNAARCVGHFLLNETGAPNIKIETLAGMLKAWPKDQLISVDMGSPLLKWEEIPVSRPNDTVRMDYQIRAETGAVFAGPSGVNMGNPHAVFFVDDVMAVPIAELGQKMAKDAFFPEGVNAGFAQVRTRNRLRLRVWERGAGLTKACGTGACAAVVAAHRAGHCERRAEVELDGGMLTIEWKANDDRVVMTGPVQIEHAGEVSL